MEKNWITENKVSSVKNQTNVGACVTFGLTSVIESVWMIQGNSEINLSEADLHFCSGRDINYNNLNFDSMSVFFAIESLKTRGVTIEEFFPWDEHWNPDEVNCILNPNRDDNSYIVSEYRLLYTFDDVNATINEIIRPAILVLMLFTPFLI